MNVKPNQAVVFLTPVVFAPLAGAISVLIARYAPGVDIDTGSLEAIFIAGATIAFAKAGLWLKGWQEYEKREATKGPDPSGTEDGLPELEAGDEPDIGGDLDEDLPDVDGPLVAGTVG